MNDNIKKYVFFSSKGGVGKTTLATNIAGICVKMGLIVCFYDLDPQKSAADFISKVTEKYRPKYTFTDIQKAPPNDVDVIIIDCPPNTDFVPPKDFLVISPTLTSAHDKHSYQTTLNLENEGYQVIRVVNQYSMVRSDDKLVREALNPCVVIGQNAAITSATNRYKTIWNYSHPSINRARNQFVYLMSRMSIGKAETLTDKDITSIGLVGEK